jgi:hypothetical protein
MGMFSMTARRHHFISQCYLRGFAADLTSPQLFVTDFKEHKQFRTSPENVALQRNFHTIDDPSQQPDVIEKKLAEFESDLGPALRRVSESGSLADDNDRGVLFFFMALLAIKNPMMRRNISAAVGEVEALRSKMEAADPEYWAEKMAAAKAEGAIPEDTDTDKLRELILDDAFQIRLSTPGHMYFEFNLVEKLLPFFHGRQWMLLRAPTDRTAFVTSDNPVCLMWQKRGRNDPPGFGRLGTEIIFAVSNELAIIGIFGGRACVANAGSDLIAIINGNIMTCVDRQLYARDNDFAYSLPHNRQPMHGTDLLDDPVSIGDEGTQIAASQD